MVFALAPSSMAGVVPISSNSGNLRSANALRSGSSAFAGRLVSPMAVEGLAQRQRQRQAASVRAYVREYPDPDFIAEVKEAFPDKGIANAEEARVLFSEAGYTYLDVRPALELEEVGKVKGCVNIPIKHSKWVYDPEARKKKIVKEDNPAFVEQVKKRFPNTEHPLLVGCSDGRTYSIDALEALDEAGYANLVGLRGGFYAWFRVWDNKLGRRRVGEYAETYTHDGDSCGIHSSGAGFEKMDPIEAWRPANF